MTILGINFGHDASAVLLRGSRILGAVEEEKMSRRKQDFGWPRQAVAVLLAQHHVQPDEVELLAFGSHHFEELGANEIRYRFSKCRWRRFWEIKDRLWAHWGFASKKISVANRAIFEQFASEMGFSRAQVVFFNHHLSHAASALFAAPFQADLVVTADGYGGQDAFNFYRSVGNAGLEKIRTNGFGTSVGQFYSAVTGLLGFRPNRHEGKITGLAAYGKPSPLCEQFQALFFYDEQERLRRLPDERLADWWREFGLQQKLRWRERVNFQSESDTGLHYARNAHALRAWLERETAGFSKEDIAFACQHTAEQVVLEEIRRALATFFPGQKVKIALAGGVFANVRINQKIAELAEVENLFVQPAMGDAGLALGAGFLADQSHNPNADPRHYVFRHTFLGPDFGAEVSGFVRHLPAGFVARKMENPAEEIAQLLFKNYIVGLWQGPMEWGPRALGRRSIILNTFDRTVNDTLNQRLNRTEFMPFAPSVLDRAAPRYFPAYRPHIPAADYMTLTYDVAPGYHELLQAVTHVDGTARPQIVRPDIDPSYYAILDAFERFSGCGAIVNTSFNAHEEPIVSTPQTAFRALEQGRIDVLVLEDFLIRPKDTEG